MARQQEETFEILACYVDGALDEMHSILIDREVLRPPHLFLGAKQVHAERLVEQLNATNARTDPQFVWRRVEALAWIGGLYVEHKFRQWDKTPPPWRRHFHRPISHTAHEAGWMLTVDDHRRDLYLPASYRLVVAQEQAEKSPLTVLKKSGDFCPWCHWPLYILFDFDLTAPVFDFMGLAGKCLCIPTCINCACYGPVFFDVDMNGKAAWWGGNKRNKGQVDDGLPPQEFLEDHLVLGNLRRTLFESLLDCGELFPSQVGGMPAWVQYSDNTPCSGCGQPMMCIGQVETADFVEELGEGIYYALLCRDCLRSTVVYQQT